MSLLVLGTGLWHMRTSQVGTGDKWLQKLTKTIDTTFHDLSAMQPMDEPVVRPWDTMDWTRSDMIHDGDLHPTSPARRQIAPHLPIADATIFVPVSELIDSMLTPWRLRATTNARSLVANAKLHEKMANAHPLPPLVVPWSLQKMAVQNESIDGMHWTPKMNDEQIELLLGWRCNDVLDTVPNGSCCKRYSWATPVQGLVLLLLAVMGPLALLRSRIGESASANGLTGQVRCPASPSFLPHLSPGPSPTLV